MLRVYLLGRFRVRGDDAPPVPQGLRAPRRPLQLLQAIAVLGPRDAAFARVAAALWPDAEGDAAAAAAGIALHRLRRLLGNQRAITLQNGRVGLDPALVWVDCEAFEARADAVERGADMDALAQALALYAGPLLADAEDHAWLLPARERLRSRYVRLVVHGAQLLEQARRSGAAIETLQRALEHEPLAEALHRALITAYARAGRAAEAEEAYRRCARMLRELLGVAPAPETQRALRGARA